MKIVRTIGLLLLLSSVWLDTFGQSRRFIEVTGRAVDEKGAPIPDVIATLFSPPCRGCIDNVVPSNRSVSEGIFFVESYATANQRFTLFVEEKVPAGFWSPFGGPPFRDLAHLPEFRGIPIKPSPQSARIDLGNVKIKIRFGRIIVAMPKTWPKLIADSTVLELRVRDRVGTLIYNGRLPTAATTESHSVRLALTPGRWSVQIKLSDNNRELISPVKSVVVRAGSCVVLPLDQSATIQPCAN